ncbi:putative 2-methylcitrate dehydratase KNAG_0D02470 [Huiozyma naganishii CBS 8797]|uniref:2-methylcitrate dehydratase n=1 Tax=Huiozyma naganishii (strain ATCC MYA-139 / BCRC 22969 / CBS 8797 / KCTC 17520 / NBRC 10181 / NCYC 3082 / Yp74L-3) TaxID=1071383 RepID=J7S6Y8_HUIN7|nr:hypothetical protein KNAG_0D02470 [Kazachstania naganishii CBS 8797]CCK69996.1 hypothetical protein KNAG_0D02470 [Kazachstania naganishii CBS 8797]
MTLFSKLRGQSRNIRYPRCFYSTQMQQNVRPEADKLLQDIATYVHSKPIDSSLALKTAKLCLLDTLGCGLAALKFDQPRQIIEPITSTLGKIPGGTRVLGTKFEMDPVNGAFALGTLIRWLDFNDCWLAAEWGHPSDNLGGILSVADFVNRAGTSPNGRKWTVRDVLEAMVKAHEIQGVLALDNSFNSHGLDHVVLVKVATASVVSKLLGLTSEQTMECVSQAWVDGQSLRTYRHAPNTGSRKSWAAGDACSRAVKLAYLVKQGNVGLIPSVLSAQTWGFYDVLNGGEPFKFTQRDSFESYVMENVLFKISFPAEFHAQTAVECSIKAHSILKQLGKTAADIKSVRIRTQDAAMRIIDKQGPLYNYADRDHCIQYMSAVPLIHGRLQANDYMDSVAEDPRIDELRAKMFCVRDEQFTLDYHDPEKRSIANALRIELNDGTVLDEIVVEYPVGHRRRREEGIPLLMSKFENHLNDHFTAEPERVQKILELAQSEKLLDTTADEFVDLFWN